MVQVNRVIQMQQQGMSDNDIVATLQNEGVSHKDISDSLAQAKIKMAVSQEGVGEYQSQGQYYQDPNQYGGQQVSQDQGQYYQDPNQYGGQQYSYQEQGMANIEIVTEIVDRVFIEKLKDINQKIREITDFKNKAEEDLNDLKERVKRIENNTDSLQRAVVSKIGDFDQTASLIHKDLDNLHGTVSKLMNPLIDNYNELKKYNTKK